MTTREIKSEIQKVLDTVPEPILEDILSYLRQVQKLSKGKVGLSHQLRQIIAEDKELLQKLAE